MHITLLVNPIAGGGRAGRAAEAVARRLREAGHEPALWPTRPGGDQAWVEEGLSRAALLVVVGGDGAVRLAAGPASRRGIPIWQLPQGTENLFAREWGMDRHAETLLRAIDAGDVAAIDLGSVAAMPAASNGAAPSSTVVDEPFTLMASMGWDAQVVHALAARRRGGISHWSYVAPGLRTLTRYVAQRLRVEADGRRVDRDGPGLVIVANSRQYAMRLDPARQASMTDGMLDVLWFPCAGLASLLGWLARCATGGHLRSKRLVHLKAERVTIESDEPFLYQLDGDAPWSGGVGAGVRRLEISVRRGALRVLRAAGR